MKLTAAIVVTAVGMVATITAPPGPPLLLSGAILVAGALALANLISWRICQFSQDCNDRHDLVIIDLRKESVVAAAEQITREAAQ